MKLFELENLKVRDKINFQGSIFILERIQLFRNGNIEYQFGVDGCDIEYFNLIVTPNNEFLKNGGNVFEEDDFNCTDEFDLNEIWRY